MLNVVIIGHNEGLYIKPMLKSLKKILPDAKRIWILDRCIDDSKETLLKNNENFVETDYDLKDRQTSHSRNLGLSLTDSDADVLFLDGDRYLIHLNKPLDVTNTDVTLLKLQDDYRDNLINYNKQAYGTVQNFFFSCGIFFKRTAINKIIDYQGYLFDEVLQYEWGIEDLYLGDVCYHLKLTCDIHPDARLQGSFERTRLSDIRVMKKRFEKRDVLDVIW